MVHAAFMISSCSLPRPSPVVVHEGAYDVVALEPLSRQPPARHPVFLDQEVIETILRGIHVQDDERLLQRLLSGRTPPTAVFSEEQRAMLSRSLVAALAQASPQQQVRFRFSVPQSQGEQTTQGLVYCAEPFLYFTLQEFHRHPLGSPTEKPGRPLPDPASLGSRRLVFHLPAYTADMTESRSANSLTINYVDIQRWLASRREDTATAERVSPVLPRADPDPRRLNGKDQVPATAQTSALNELIARKDLEIESLKNEIRDLRQSLMAEQAEVKRLKQVLDKGRHR